MLKSSVNESALLSAACLMTPGLRARTGTYYSQTRRCTPDTHWQTVAPFSPSCCRSVFPSIETNEMVGMSISLCETMSDCTSRLLSLLETKWRLPPWNLKKKKKKGKKTSTEMLCHPLFVRFWVIRLFMWAGTPRQWSNDMSLQVVCRVFLGFWEAYMLKFPQGWHQCVCVCGGGSRGLYTYYGNFSASDNIYKVLLQDRYAWSTIFMITKKT